MKPKTPELAKTGAGLPPSVTPAPTVNITAITTTTSTSKTFKTPKTNLSSPTAKKQKSRILQTSQMLEKKEKEREVDGDSSTRGGGSSSTTKTTASIVSTPSFATNVENLLTWWKATLGGNWTMLKMILVVIQLIALVIAIFYHLLIPLLSTDYQKAVLFNDPMKYGDAGVPADGKWGSILRHMFILFMLFVVVPAGELYCTLKDYLPIGNETGGNRQLFLGSFLAVRFVDNAALVFYTHYYSSYVYLLLANFAITMLLAFALFEARSKDKLGEKGKDGLPPSSTTASQNSDETHLDTPFNVGVMSGTEDVSPIFAAQASKAAAAAKKPKKAAGSAASGLKSTSFMKKTAVDVSGGRGNSLLAFNAV